MKTLALFFFLFLLSFKANCQTVFCDPTSNEESTIAVDKNKIEEKSIARNHDSSEMFEYLGYYYYKFKDYQRSKQYFDILYKKYKLPQIS